MDNSAKVEYKFFSCRLGFEQSQTVMVSLAYSVANVAMALRLVLTDPQDWIG
jgi:hypothetical protein